MLTGTVSTWDDNEVLKTEGGDGCRTMSEDLTPLGYSYSGDVYAPCSLSQLKKKIQQAEPHTIMRKNACTEPVHTVGPRAQIPFTMISRIK